MVNENLKFLWGCHIQTKDEIRASGLNLYVVALEVTPASNYCEVIGLTDPDNISAAAKEEEKFDKFQDLVREMEKNIKVPKQVNIPHGFGEIIVSKYCQVLQATGDPSQASCNYLAI